MKKSKKARRVVLGTGDFQSFNGMTTVGLGDGYPQPENCDRLQNCGPLWGKRVRLVAEIL